MFSNLKQLTLSLEAEDCYGASIVSVLWTVSSVDYNKTSEAVEKFDWYQAGPATDGAAAGFLVQNLSEDSGGR